MAQAQAAAVLGPISPATGEALEPRPTATVEDLRRAVDRAREAQRSWGALPVSARVRAMREVQAHLVAHADELAEIISRDNGKTRSDALYAEVMPAAVGLSYYLKNAGRLLTPRRLGRSSPFFFNKTSRLYRVPFGVVGVIAPWNYPFGIPFPEVAMALLAGNAVIFKGASETQQVSEALARCFAGLPEGLLHEINMPGRVAGDAFLEAGIDKLFFTGSVPVGKKLMAKAAETLTPVSLELGGNDAMIVCADADLDRAAAGATWAGFQNCGQSCGGVERIYVERAVAEPFLERLGARVGALRIGPDRDFDVDLGAMTTSRQMELVRRHIDDALARGARVHAQAQPPEGIPGNFMPATVLVDVDHTMAVMREESFGPVVGVMVVDSIDQAVELANDSNLGLTGSVWTRDTRKGIEIGRRIRAGAVLVNDHLMSHGMAETPWGGFKESGIGRAHGALGFDEMTQPQVIVTDALPAKKQLWWHPHDRPLYEGMRGLLAVLFGPGVGARLAGLRKALAVVPRMFSRG